MILFDIINTLCFIVIACRLEDAVFYLRNIKKHTRAIDDKIPAE